MALSSSTLTNASSDNAFSFMQRNNQRAALELKVIDAALKARVKWKVVRKSSEIRERMTANVKCWNNIEPRHIARGISGYVELPVNIQRCFAALANNLYVVGNHFVFTIMKSERFLSENPPRATAKVPSQHNVALDETDC
jgi:hypothetical protein